PEMSLLAFSGLLGGLLKDGKKIGVAAGLLIGRCLWSFMQMKQIGCSRFLLLVVLFFYFVSRQDVYQINWHLLFQERKLIQMNKSSIYKKFAMLQPGV